MKKLILFTFTFVIFILLSPTSADAIRNATGIGAQYVEACLQESVDVNISWTPPQKTFKNYGKTYTLKKYKITTNVNGGKNYHSEISANESSIKIRSILDASYKITIRSEYHDGWFDWDGYDASFDYPTLSFQCETPAGYTQCAEEGGTCKFNGKATVKYGARGRYTVRDFTNSAACNISNFGDPAPGLKKGCFYKLVSPKPKTEKDISCEQKNPQSPGAFCGNRFSCTSGMLPSAGTSCNQDTWETCCVKEPGVPQERPSDEDTGGGGAPPASQCTEPNFPNLCGNSCHYKCSDSNPTGGTCTNGDWKCSTVSAPIPPKPSMPSGLSLSAPVCSVKSSDGTVNTELKWNPVEGATSYKVYLWNGKTWDLVKDVGTATNYKWEGLKQKTGYTFGVEAFTGQVGSGIAFLGIGTPVDCRERLKPDQAAAIVFEARNAESDNWNSTGLDVKKQGEYFLRAKISSTASTGDIKYSFFCNTYAGLPQFETTTKETSISMPKACKFQTLNKIWHTGVNVSIGGKTEVERIGTSANLPIRLLQPSTNPGTPTTPPQILTPSPIAIPDSPPVILTPSPIAIPGSPSTISGVVFIDTNLNGKRDDGEAPFDSQGKDSVYIARYVNRNGKYASGLATRLFVNTGADGKFLFINLVESGYQVGAVPTGYRQTTPLTFIEVPPSKTVDIGIVKR